MKWIATRDEQAHEGRGSDSPRWRGDVDGRAFSVDVAPGPGLLLRLERAICDHLGIALPTAPQPARYRVDESTYSHGDLFELEQDTIWTVVDVAAGKPLWEFRGGTSHSFSGGQWSASTGSHGCDEVVLGADGMHVLARDYGEVKCHPLPR